MLEAVVVAAVSVAVDAAAWAAGSVDMAAWAVGSLDAVEWACIRWEAAWECAR
jgi:hypothetical protein